MDAVYQAQKADPLLKSNVVYLITDGLPTTRMECDVGAEPCDGVTNNIERAARVAKLLIEDGTTVIGVSVGTDVTDANLSAISGPCPPFPLSCAANLNFFHAVSFAGLSDTLGQSFNLRFPSSSTTEEETTSETTKEHKTHRTHPTHSPASATPVVTTTTTTKQRKVETPSPVTVRTRPTSVPVKGKRADVHSDAWLFPVIMGGLIGLCLLIAIAVACCCARAQPAEQYSSYVQKGDVEAPPLPLAPNQSRIESNVNKGGGGGGPRLVQPNYGRKNK